MTRDLANLSKWQKAKLRKKAAQNCGDKKVIENQDKNKPSSGKITTQENDDNDKLMEMESSAELQFAQIYDTVFVINCLERKSHKSKRLTFSGDRSKELSKSLSMFGPGEIPNYSSG